MSYISNVVLVCGYVADEPDVRYTQGANPMCVARYRVGVNRRGSNTGADFIPVVAFGKAGEYAEKYFRKGTAVSVSGQLRTSTWKKNDGTTGKRTELIADRHSSEKDGTWQMNRIFLEGRLTRDPEIRVAGSGDSASSVANFTVAVQRPWTGRQAQGDETDFFPCVLWGQQAEFASKWLHKGTAVYLEGRIVPRSYVNNNGERVYTTEIVGTDVGFARKKSGSEGDNAANGNVPDRQDPGHADASAEKPADAYAGQSATAADAPGPSSSTGRNDSFDSLDGFISLPDGIDDDDDDYLPFN